MKTLLLGLLVAVAPVASRADEVADFHCKAPKSGASANVGEVYAAYGERSVAIVKAGLAGDAAQLREMVAPTAKFTLFQGDVGIGPRSSGAEAAIAFVKQVAPRNYEFSAGSRGPFSMAPCGSVTAELTLMGDKANEAVIARFKYERGILQEVQASGVVMEAGDFSKPLAR